jgi:2'-5' RNA ligase
MSRTALVVKAPASDKLVALRQQLARDARVGVPPHITVLFPFVPVAQLDESAMTLLHHALGTIPRFDFALTRTGWFGDNVLWLAPDDPSPFVELTAAVHRAFPDYPPYGGLHDGSVPHATVADSGPSELLTHAEREIRDTLPLRGRAAEVTLLTEGADGLWRESHRVPLRDRY